MHIRRYLPLVLVLFIPALLSTGGIIAYSHQQDSIKKARDTAQNTTFEEIDRQIAEQRAQAKAGHSQTHSADTHSTAGNSKNAMSKTAAAKKNSPAAKIPRQAEHSTCVESIITNSQNTLTDPPKAKTLPATAQSCKK